MKQTTPPYRLVCVRLRNDIEDFLIGYLEGNDENGIVIQNIDYRGKATGHIYLSAERIQGYIEKEDYIRKLMALYEKEENPEPVPMSSENGGLLDCFLNWCCQNPGMITITDPDEAIIGYIDKIGREAVRLKIISCDSGFPDGMTIIRKDKLQNMMLLQ